MKERPILFNSEMVRAVLDGRKTQTRRVIKPPPSAGVRNSVFVKSGLEDGHGYELKSPYGVPGDRLWVRETFAPPHVEAFGCRYRATHDLTDSKNPPPQKWIPSIHMPRHASRIDLEITDVRVERVQDISNEDARNEGVEKYMFSNDLTGHWRDGFIHLWDSIYFKDGYGWDDNPWVWVVEFKRITSDN